MKRVTPKEAQQLMEQGWTYLDVRSEPEFEEGHPKGALNIPLMHRGPGGMTPNPDFMKVVEAVLPKDAKLVVGCQAGGRSAKATQLMQGSGYQQLADQYCGWGGARDPMGRVTPGWAAEGLPVEQGSPAGRAYRELQKKG
jgi:rhodanese-related sulfurtransferase